jgi:hypothetical protein
MLLREKSKGHMEQMIHIQIAVCRGARRAPEGNFLKEVSLWTPFKNFQKRY